MKYLNTQLRSIHFSLLSANMPIPPTVHCGPACANTEERPALDSEAGCAGTSNQQPTGRSQQAAGNKREATASKMLQQFIDLTTTIKNRRKGGDKRGEWSERERVTEGQTETESTKPLP